MRLIDADALMEKEYSRLRKGEVLYRIPPSHVDTVPIINPVHAANACYCKECWYYTEWGECKEFGDIMKPDEFCSRGVIKND